MATHAPMHEKYMHARTNTIYHKTYEHTRMQARVRTHMFVRIFTRIHMKTRTDGAVPIMNQYDTCQLIQKWFLVCWAVSF